MLRQALMHLSQQDQLRALATHNPAARTMARRFVAGESLDDAVDVVRKINAQGMTATLDHLGENVSSGSEATEAADAYRRMLQAIDQAGVQCNVSLKLTHMGLDLGDAFARDNTVRVVDEAATLGNFVRIDMEGSEYVERTLDVFYRIYEQYKNVGIVIQAYLYRSRADIEQLLDVGARIRLVKGAYLEPPTVAFASKAEVDRHFAVLTEMMLSRGNYPAIATHDPAIITAAERYVNEHQIDRGSFEFQMLYGIRRDLQTMLVREGYNMRVYVPYGTEWYPYLMRRLAERPANVMFVAGNMVREVWPRQR